MRRIIQIAVWEGYTHALCDDGSLWELDSGQWTQLPDIPQDKPHENKITFEKISQERNEK